MLSTTSGFSPDQTTRFKALFHLLLVGVGIMIFGLGILCFGRMYTFDSTKYDLFLVFGVIIVVIASATMILPVYCQLRIYLEVRHAMKDDTEASGTYGQGLPYSQALQQGMQAKPQGMAVLYATGNYQHQLPFSSASYMMGKQEQQHQQPMVQQMDADPCQFKASLASEDTRRHKGCNPIWSTTDKQPL